MDGGRPSVSELSRGEYGARVGLGHVVDLLADFEIPASFFIPAVSALLHPTIVETIQSNQDHEIGIHGWIHEHPSWLREPDEELSLMERSLNVLTEQSGTAGTRPVGYRAPAYDLHAHTFAILEQLEFLYDSSLMADDATVLDPRGENYTSPREWLRTLTDEFDAAYEEKTGFSHRCSPRAHRAHSCQRRRVVRDPPASGGGSQEAAC